MYMYLLEVGTHMCGRIVTVASAGMRLPFVLDRMAHGAARPRRTTRAVARSQQSTRCQRERDKENQYGAT